MDSLIERVARAMVDAMASEVSSTGKPHIDIYARAAITEVMDWMAEPEEEVFGKLVEAINGRGCGLTMGTQVLSSCLEVFRKEALGDEGC